MRTSIAISLIGIGALLLITPILVLQWRLERAANYYQEHGSGSLLPEELRPRPHDAYDWSVLVIGATLAMSGIIGSLISRRSYSPNSTEPMRPLQARYDPEFGSDPTKTSPIQTSPNQRL